VPDLFDVVLGQRACRDFLPDPVPDADVERMLEAATHAPSAENLQPWVFVVVTDAKARRGVVELLRQAWAGGAEAYSRGRLAEHLFTDVAHGVEEGIGRAPVLVVVAVDTDVVADHSVASSIFPAVQNLLLAAGALGYGCALTTLAAARPAKLSALLTLPAHVRPIAVVPIGRPARPLGPPRRQPVAAKAHRDRYGTPFR
jgi:nitroreductase